MAISVFSNAGNVREVRPMCTVFYLGSFVQRNAPDHESDDPFSDRSYQCPINPLDH